jgi:hypothetical protein
MLEIETLSHIQMFHVIDHVLEAGRKLQTTH